MDQQKQDTLSRSPDPDIIPAQGAGIPPGDASLPSEDTASARAGDIEENFIELLGDTLRELEQPVQGAFLQKFVKCLACVEVSEGDSLVHWQEILRRRKELTALLNRAMSLRTAAVDYFGSAGLLRNPILLEYEELKRLRHSAATDPLTGFYNRRLFEDYLARELNRASRYNMPFALLLIDLRSFKKVNDTYGHSAGDEILRSVPRACTETIRGSDYPFRIGGDEFALLLPQSDRRSAEALARRIAQKFEQSGEAIAPSSRVGLDYGVASFPTDGANAAALFEAADRNLYANKKNAYRQLEGPRADVAPSRTNADISRRLADQAEATPSTPTPSRQNPGAEGTAPATPDAESTRRQHERFPLQGTWSLGVVLVGPYPELVRILDVSTGGVALLMNESVTLPDKFQARLNVPIFSASGLTLRRMYALRTTEGKQRVGCAFDA